MSKDRKQWLDTLLQPDPTRGLTPLSWLRREAVSNSSRAILGNLEKLAFLRNAGVEEWSLETLNPNRLKFLAQVARKSGAQTLQRAPAERRYPVLLGRNGSRRMTQPATETLARGTDTSSYEPV